MDSAVANTDTQPLAAGLAGSPDARSFLQSLFGRAMVPDRGLCVRTLRHGVDEPTQHRYGDIDSVLTDPYLSERNADGASVYIGTALRDLRSEAWSRKPGCAAITCLWCDFDAKDFIQPADRKALTIEERDLGKSQILRVIAQRLPDGLQPSIVVDTGGGYQAYWLLSEAAVIGPDGHPAAFYEGVLAGLQKALNADITRKDVSSLMRLPGTINHKYADRPVCRIIQMYPDLRFSLDQFERYRLTLTPDPALVSEPQTRAMRPVGAGEDWEALLEAFNATGRYLSRRGDKHLVRCPWADGHSSQNESETALYPPSKANEWSGGFKCHHHHCVDRGIGDVYAFFGFLPENHETGERASRLLTLGEAAARVGQHVDWVVDKMLAVGDMSLWVAKPGIGKSALLRQMTWAVSRGEPFLGRATRKGLAVYLALEGARATIQHLKLLGVSDDDPNVRLWIDEVNMKNPVGWLKSTLAETDPALIVVDCLFDFTSIKENSANAGYSEIYSSLGPVLRFAQDRRVHIALIHHASKMADQGSIDAALGSTGITGKPGTVMNYRLMDPQDRGSNRILSCSKHRSGDVSDLPDVVLGWDAKTQTLSVQGRHEDLVLWNAGISVLEALKSYPDGYPQTTLLRELDGRRATNLKAIGKLVELGLVKRHGGRAMDGGPTKSNPVTLRLAVRVDDPVLAWETALRSRAAVENPPAGSSSQDPQKTRSSSQNSGTRSGLTAAEVSQHSPIQFPQFPPPLNNPPGTRSSFFSVETKNPLHVEVTLQGSAAERGWSANGVASGQSEGAA